MVNLWLSTISIFGLLLVIIACIYYGLKHSLHIKDAYEIDPLPEDIDKKDKE